ncbi:MAG: hypothetical protein F6J96_20175 [Symploca sp. SIO1C2]|nr:hypothetical protein [Symploca sp. SIO1C2]
MTISSLFRFCASQLAIAGILAMVIPPKPAVSSNEFNTCAAELLRANISRNLAADVCAEALYPEDLSLCVLTIKAQTPIVADEALYGCQRVRRPLELASCIVEINHHTSNPEVLLAFDRCRRSLLPLRFSECVIGLSQEIDFSSTQAIETCITAED